MTSIAVKVEQRIAILISRESGEAPRKVNYLRHYINYLLIRSCFRGVLMILSNWMASFPKPQQTQTETYSSEISVTNKDILTISLYIFGGISLYFAVHGICCFEELKVAASDSAIKLEKPQHEFDKTFQRDP